MSNRLTRAARRFPEPDTMKVGRCGWCKWCGDAIPVVIDGRRSTQRMWHPACAYEYQLHTDSAVQKEYLVERDGHRCDECPPGTPAPQRWLKGAEHSDMRGTPPMPWDGPRVGQLYIDTLLAYRKVNPYPRWTEVRRVCALQVDHRVPLWSVEHLPPEKRRRYFGPENLQLLCPDHHRAKTAREAGERALTRRRVAA